MNGLIPLVLRNTEEVFATYGDEVPFGFSKDDFLQYATDRGTRRLGTISSARGRPVDDIDVDYSPIQLEEAFSNEDQKALTT